MWGGFFCIIYFLFSKLRGTDGWIARMGDITVPPAPGNLATLIVFAGAKPGFFFFFSKIPKNKIDGGGISQFYEYMGGQKVAG